MVSLFFSSLVAQLQLDIFGAGASDIGIKVGPVGNFRHQGFGKA